MPSKSPKRRGRKAKPMSGAERQAKYRQNLLLILEGAKLADLAKRISPCAPGRILSPGRVFFIDYLHLRTAGLGRDAAITGIAVKYNASPVSVRKIVTDFDPNNKGVDADVSHVPLERKRKGVTRLDPALRLRPDRIADVLETRAATGQTSTAADVIQGTWYMGSERTFWRQMHALGYGWRRSKKAPRLPTNTDEWQRRRAAYTCDFAEEIEREEEVGDSVVVYMDEAYIDCTHHRAFTITNLNDRSRTAIAGTNGGGQRLMIIHAMTRHGILTAAPDHTPTQAPPPLQTTLPSTPAAVKAAITAAATAAAAATDSKMATASASASALSASKKKKQRRYTLVQEQLKLRNKQLIAFTTNPAPNLPPLLLPDGDDEMRMQLLVDNAAEATASASGSGSGSAGSAAAAAERATLNTKFLELPLAETGPAESAQMFYFSGSPPAADYHQNINGEMIAKWARDRLFPAFRKLFPNKRLVLVLDNCSTHKTHDSDWVDPNKSNKRRAADALRDLGVKQFTVRRDGELFTFAYDSWAKHKSPFSPSAKELKDELRKALHASQTANRTLLQKVFDEQNAIDKRDGKDKHKLLWTVPYESESQPIEKMWGMTKERVAAAHRKGRSKSQLYADTITAFYRTAGGVLPSHCASWVEHSIKYLNSWICTNPFLRKLFPENCPSTSLVLRQLNSERRASFRKSNTVQSVDSFTVDLFSDDDSDS